MASDENIAPLTKSIDAALKFKETELVTREQWGSITFGKAHHDLDRVFSIVSYLKVLPLNQLTDQAVQQITQNLDAVNNLLGAIDKFTVEQSNPPGTRDQLVNQIHSATDQFYTIATPWVPFLAYQRGDVTRNINELTAAVTQGKAIAADAKAAIETQQKEMEAIITKAREASASAGAAVFTHDFAKESKEQLETAKHWLIATTSLAIVTAVVAGLMWYFVEPASAPGVLSQKLGTKIAVLVVLFSATVWCGRMYRTLMHQSTINRHRALSLQTFQAFLAAAADVATKDAVLVEATHAIFTVGKTGYLDGKSSEVDSGIRILEVTKGSMTGRAVSAVSDAVAT